MTVMIDLDADAQDMDRLADGWTLLRGQYAIESFLRAGGFGNTYRARDSLGRLVVLKECYPSMLCRRAGERVEPASPAKAEMLQVATRLFIDEAHTLARLDHPNIVRVRQVFEENGTAYMALDHVEGHDLADIAERGRNALPPEKVMAVTKAMLAALEQVHGAGLLHRDVAPDNIVVASDGTPVLIDFGAARSMGSSAREVTSLRAVKDGYSPIELYPDGGVQGPWSDLYALAASLHHLIVGTPPPAADHRRDTVAEGGSDPYVPLAGMPDGHVAAFDDAFLASLDKALALAPADRFRSSAEWRAALAGAPSVTRTKRSRLVPVFGLAAAAGVAGLAVMFGSAEPPPPPDAALASATPAPAPTPDGAAESPATRESEPADRPVPVVLAVDDALAKMLPMTAGLDAPMLSAGAPIADLVDSAKLLAVFGQQTDPVAPMQRDAPPLAMPDLPVPVLAMVRTVPPPPVRPVEPDMSADRDADRVVFHADGMLTAWTVMFPEDIPAAAIRAVDGVAVTDRRDLDRAVRRAALSADVDPDAGNAVLTLRVLQQDDGTARDVTRRLPIVQRTQLLNGLVFESRRGTEGWITKVAHVPSRLSDRLTEGDVIVGYVPTAERLSGRLGLPALIEKASDRGDATLTFAVARGDEVRAVSVPAFASGRE